MPTNLYCARTYTSYDRMLSRAFHLRRIEMSQTAPSPRAPDPKPFCAPSNRTAELIAALSKLTNWPQKAATRSAHTAHSGVPNA